MWMAHFYGINTKKYPQHSKKHWYQSRFNINNADTVDHLANNKIQSTLSKFHVFTSRPGSYTLQKISGVLTHFPF
jgi:hypothetical protein